LYLMGEQGKMAKKISKNFESDKEKLLTICQQIESLGYDGNVSAKLNEIRRNLRDERFRLVILGQFKRGKSTFINALLGERVLPTDVIPVTAVITELLYDSRKFTEIIFTDQHREEYPLPELARFVSESENPHNEKGVDKVVVHHPAPILSQGLILVDTPGVGSIHHHNTRLTQEYIPNIDAAIFLFSADPPLTELEQAFLKIILPVVPHVFFILNKKDYLKATSLEKVLQFNARILKVLRQDSLRIYPISALQALHARLDGNITDYQASGVEEFENVLEEFLVQHKGRFLLLSNAERLEHIVLERKNLIDMEQQAHMLSVEKLQNNLHEFEIFMDNIKRRKQRLSFLLEGIRTKLMEHFDQRAQLFLEKHAREIQTELDHYLQEHANTSKKTLLRAGEKFINEAIVDHFEPFRLQIEKELKEIYQTEIQMLNQETLDIINRIYQYSAELFQMKEMTVLPKDVWQFESQFYYKTWETITTLDLLENDLITLLPRFLFLHIFRQKTNKLIYQKLERQGGRLRADILYRIQDSNRQFIYEFEQTIDRIQQEIVNLIHKHVELKEKGEKVLDQLLQEQSRQLKRIKDISGEITNIIKNWKVVTTTANKQTQGAM